MSSDTTCFKRKSDFTLENNELVIKKSALKYQQDRVYKFLVRTQIPGYSQVYSQEVSVVVEHFFQLPVMQITYNFYSLNIIYLNMLFVLHVFVFIEFVSCFPVDTCVPYNNYQLINPNSQIILNGACDDGCDKLLVDVEYKWIISKLTRTGSKCELASIQMAVYLKRLNV